MLPEIPHAKGREALAKATKDLMSLDSAWGAPASGTTSANHFSQRTYGYGSHSTQPNQFSYDPPRNSPHSSLFQPHQQRHTVQHAPFPYPSKMTSSSSISSQRSHPDTSFSSHHTSPPISVAPIHTLSASSDQGGSSSLHPYSSPPNTSSSSNSSYSFPNSSRGQDGASSSSKVPSPPSSSSSMRAVGSPENTSSNKRSLDSSSTTSANKRPRPSPPSTTNGAATAAKSTLLSPSQKKANHIQSEQKRRANIRRGYEALCETVPALREAIRLEEEAQASGKSRRGRGRGKIDEGTGEKIDGRAGPRSENIVLGKTIDYINELLNDREALLTRLERARGVLTPEHPSLMKSDAQPLWEREWKGGSGKDADADDDDDEDDEE
ncbi:hypothetical protein VNI00_013232 [Paramarasmius palmivorus]|uniref:BHLH domain-containing protein n=1 Tax=Paramarasmius palmivorus TaxID=297713 RepID=A0AAW0BZB8_9AGAR